MTCLGLLLQRKCHFGIAVLRCKSNLAIRYLSVLVLTVAAELVAKRDDVKGPGTFLPGLVDVLWKLTPEDVLKAAKITIK